ncbi:hypothetical protein [Bradyrhizobium sp. CCGUVB23]
MGRAMRRFQINGYLISPNHLVLKDISKPMARARGACHCPTWRGY